MEDTWQVKSGSAWPHLPPPSSLVPPLPPPAAPMPDSANQMGLNSLQFSRSFVQKTNLRDNAAVREPMVFNTLNLDSCKSGKGELANSFLGLISGDSHHVSSGVLSLPYSSSLSTKLRVCDGGIVSSASFGVPNTSIPPLLEAHGNDVMGNGRRSPFVASRPLSTFTSNKSPFLHSNFQVVASPRHDIDSCKLATHQAFQGNVAGSEAISSRHGLPTMPSSLNTNQQHTLNWKSEKMPLEAKPSISSHSSTFQGRPHVFCMNKVGELFVSDMGLLGVICFCHKLPMSVAKFCEHSGLTSADPSEAVRLENGMTVAQWRVLCSGIMASDPSNGWDWSDGSSSEGFFARSKSSNLPTSSKNPLSINSIEAFGGVGRYGGHPNLFTFANHTSAGLGGQIASGKSPNKDADNAHSSNGSMTHNPFPKCFTASMKSSMLLARNHTVQEARGSPVCISFQGAHSTLNKGKQSTGAQLIPNNANSKGEIGNLPVFYPCLGTEKASNCNNHIHRGNISKEEACAAAQDGIDLRLGHPSHNDHTSRSAFENSKHCLQSGTIFNSKGPQLTHMSVFPREAKKTTINPQCMSLEASLFDRTSHHAVGSGSLKNSESEDPTSDATKNSLVMFLSHLNSEGNRPSQFANNIGRDNECHMTRVPDTDFLYAEGNLSDLTGVIHDGTERKSNRYGSILSNNIDQVKEQGELDDNSNRTLNPSYSVNIKQPINTSIHSPGCCIHSSLMDYKQSKSNYNQPSRLLRTLSETSNSNQCAEVCFPGNYNLYDHDLHIPTSSVPKGTEKPGLINLETSTSLSLTNSTYISKQDFGLSDWKNTDRTQNLGDGSFRSFSLRNMAEVSKPEQSTLPLEMCPQQRRLLDLGSQKKAYKDALMPPEVLRGPYCSIERDGPKVTARPVHSFSNCYSGGATQMLSGKSGTTGPCKFCNCCASTKRKTFPQEYGIQFSLSQPNICHAHEQPCLRLGRISDISHSDSVNSELYNQREKNSSVSMKCCCAALPMCLTGCCFPRGDKLSSALDEHGCSRSRIIYSNPPYDNSHMLQDGKRIRLGQCACLRKHIPVKNDGHNALWRDVSNKGIRHFGTTIETPIDNLHITRTIEDQITEISGKELEGTQQESSMKEQQMSNVCSGTSAPALTEVSVEVGNSVTLAMDVENTKIVHDLVVDEGSRIEKSGSSDEEHDSRLCAELLTLKDKVKSGLHCGRSSSSVGIVNELRLKSSNLKRLRNDISHRCTGKESTDQIKQFKRVEKAEKKMEPMKWSILDASFQMSAFPSQCSESSEHVDGSSNHSSSKEIEPLSQPELVMQETCILSNRSSSVKRKRSALSSSKSFFVKRLENHHITGEYNRMLSIHDDHSLRKKKVSSGKKIKENLDRMMIQKDIHVTAEKTPKYISLSCIGNSPDLVMDTSYNTGKPIVCDNSGIISSGPSDRQKPAKIVPLSLILKKASRCSITKYEEKPREAFISKSQLNANSRQWKACEDADSSDVIRNGVNPTIGFSGNEQHTSNLCSKKILKHALLADSRLVNSSHNDQGLMSKQYEENKSKVHEGKSSLDSEAFCCVCGSSKKEDLNHLLECNRCLVRVHQACYGVSKVPKGHWCCRPCKTNSLNIVCVLCGYGGGAMTRALKTTNTVKSLLKAWKVGIRSHLINSVPSKGIKNDFLKLDSVSDASDCDLGSISSGFFPRAVSEMDLQETNTIQHSDGFPNDFQACNSIATGIIDPSVTQWVHMVCGLWTPGTRCPNVDTMSAFDVSGALTARNGIVCSMCNRPGGSCIQCRVLNCSVHFHPWCAHTKGLLQSEIEGDDNEKVGFYGRCLLHATHNSCDPVDTEVESPRTKDWACARTEGFKGRKRDEGFNCNRVKPFNDGGCIVSQEQINVWLHINGQKSCTRGVVKLPCSDMEYDIRKEYIRYKQLKGWKQLVVYKSGIHALGLYTSQFIAKGAMVVEYVGEIVGLRVADKRELEYQSGRRLQYKSACYFFRIDKEHIIDATRKGGIARFVNHSCLPNCVAKIISIRNEKKVVFFAERDIFPGEEITYDYHFNHEDEGKKIPCFCNSKNCRRYLN